MKAIQQYFITHTFDIKRNDVVMRQRKKPSQLATSELALAKAKVDALRWKQRYKDVLVAANCIQEQRDVLLEIPKHPTIQRIAQIKKGKSIGVAVVAPATDWHVEEKVTKEATSGKNEFNLVIAETRIKRFYQKVLELIDWQNHLAPVTELWHPILGDLLSGYIHEELMESNLLSPTEACIFLQEMICSGINLWRRKTDIPIFIPTCVGNHSRTTQKRRIKTRNQNSFEWLLYMTLAKYYASDSRIEWRIGKGIYNIQKIMGRKVRFSHGDDTRYNGGIGGITIPVNKTVAAWDKIEEVDFDIFGHWHQFLPHYPKWIACGSLMGFSEFSISIKAEFQHPTQTFIVIDRGYGTTLATPIFLEKVKK